MKCLLAMFVIASSSFADAQPIGPLPPAAGPLTAADRQYLEKACKETWACMVSLENPTTGLPYDNSDKGEYTSVSNIGIWLTSVIAARDLGYISVNDARKRIQKTLGSMERFEKNFGFQQTWNSVTTLKPAKHDPWISILDTGNLAAGLLTVASADPALARRANALFNELQWSKFVRDDGKYLVGGYNAEKHEFNEAWHLDLLASDALLAQFFAVATDQAPPKVFDGLRTGTETRAGVTYLEPGWNGGGLFMQRVSGLWLDLRGSLVGKSASAFAWSQYKLAQEKKLKAWGWSASDSPTGEYLGWGALKESVVTPHACALAAEFLPSEAAANLRALESMGARSEKLGFYDSVDLTSGKVGKRFLVWDQGMMFVALAQVLKPHCIQKLVGNHPVVVKGRQALQGKF